MMDEAVERFMEICSTIIQPPDDSKARLRLAVEAVKIKNTFDLDLSQPSKLCIDGKNPFFEACRLGHFPIVKLFLANRACPNVFNSNGSTPLHVAISSIYGNDSVVDALLKAGADANLYKRGRSPLLASFYNMKISTSMKLIQRGADVNDPILPAFCFVESVFSLNSNLVLVASGVHFQLEEFDQLMVLSRDIVKAGLAPRTFYLTGRKSFKEGFSSEELSALWQFQSLCLAVGFKVDRYSLQCALVSIHEALANVTDSRHRQSLYTQIKNFHIMDHIMSNPLSLTRLARVTLRSHLAAIRTAPTSKHLIEKIELLPVPKMVKNFISLEGL